MIFKFILEDPTSFKVLKTTKQRYRHIFDWNLNDQTGSGWKYVNAYCYKAYYNDQKFIEFQIDPSIGSDVAHETSAWLAEMLGRVPIVFRGCVRTFMIAPGM